MNDDKLLDELGRVAREEPLLDGRWDAYAAGELSAEEEAALRAEAERTPEGRAALEAFAPLGAEFRARVAGEVRASVAATAGANVEPQDQAGAGSKVISLASRRRRTWAPLALAASLLLAVGLIVLNQPGSPDIPGYGLNLEGYVQQVRGESSPVEEFVYADGNRFRLLLTPDTPVEGRVVTRALIASAGATLPLEAPAARISDSGSVLIEGVVGRDLHLPEGDSRLLIAVASEDALPDAAALKAALRERASVRETAWTGWAIRLRLE